MSKQQLLIAGTGALATLFAARLAAAGIDVTLFGTWLEGIEALNSKGAQVEGEPAQKVQAKLELPPGTAILHALLLVKSWQTEYTVRRLAGHLSDDSLVVSLQNGLHNDAILSGILTKNQQACRQVYAGVTTLGATLLTPGVVRLAGEGPVWLESNTILTPLAEVLHSAGFHVNREDDIRPRIWGKLVINAAINPLTAIFRVKNGALLEDPAAHELLCALARETAMVAQASGINLPYPNPAQAAEEVAERTKENLSSMYRDILRGARTEIEAINGEVVRIGEGLGVPTRINRKVLSLVQRQQRMTPSALIAMVRLEQT